MSSKLFKLRLQLEIDLIAESTKDYHFDNINELTGMLREEFKKLHEELEGAPKYDEPITDLWIRNKTVPESYHSTLIFLEDYRKDEKGTVAYAAVELLSAIGILPDTAGVRVQFTHHPAMEVNGKVVYSGLTADCDLAKYLGLTVVECHDGGLIVIDQYGGLIRYIDSKETFVNNHLQDRARAIMSKLWKTVFLITKDFDAKAIIAAVSKIPLAQDGHIYAVELE